MKSKVRLLAAALALLVLILPLAGCSATQPLVAYINKAGEVVILPNYVAGQPFSEGQAAVRVGVSTYAYWGTINTQGENVLKAQYNDIRPLQEGLIAVQSGGKEDSPWVYLDAAGNQAIEGEFRDASVFVNGLAAVQQNLAPNMDG